MSVPEGWLVEKDEQGIESFLSPDGTSLANRRLNNSILNHTIALFCVEMISHRTILIQCGENVSTQLISELLTGEYISTLNHAFNWSPFCIDTRPVKLQNTNLTFGINLKTFRHSNVEI